MNRFVCRQSIQELNYTQTSPYSSIPYNYSALSERILLSAIPNSIQSTIPVGKIIREVSKTLKLNVFECSILHSILLTDNFNYQALKTNRAIQQLVKFDQFVYSNEKYAEVFLLIMLNAYYAKTLANKEVDLERFRTQIQKVIPSFQPTYKEWVEKKPLRKISLIEINGIFKKNSFLGVKEEVVENYNYLVDQILEMSKPYNSNKNQEAIQQQENEESSSSRVKERVGRRKKQRETLREKQRQKQAQNPKKNRPQKMITQEPNEEPDAGPIREVNKSDRDVFTSLKYSMKMLLHSTGGAPPQFNPTLSDESPVGPLFRNSSDLMDRGSFRRIQASKEEPNSINMINSLESVRFWDTNDFYDTKNLLKSSVHKPPQLDFSLKQPSPPDAERKPIKTKKQTVQKPEFRVVESDNQCE